MSLLQIIVLALVQGVSEFLPVPEEPHLTFIARLTGWADQGRDLVFAIHIGALVAVLLYFWRDVGAMVGALGRAANQLARGRRLDKEFWLVFKLLVATIPAIGAGYLVATYEPTVLRSLELMAWTTLGFGILLYLIDKMFMTVRRMEHITFVEAFILGCLQALALVPGVNRSAITMTGARLLGVERPDAARFSFLMAIPALAASCIFEGYQLYISGDGGRLPDAAMAGAMSLIFGLMAIAFLMAWLKDATFASFAVYRVIIGVGLLVLIYGLPF